MVLRKPSPSINGTSTVMSAPSVPYPTTPETERPAVVPDNGLTPPSQIFSHDLNHSPAFSLRPLDQAQTASSNTVDNPWVNEPRISAGKGELPSALRAGASKMDQEKSQGSSRLPASLQIGQMRQQLTPRSSSESDRSQDSWERDDDEDEEEDQGKQSSLGAKPRTEQSTEAQNSASTLGIPYPDPPSPQGIKRKPVATSTSPPSTGLPASLSPGPTPLGSRNPFRRNQSVDLNAGQPDILSSSATDKGKNRMPETPPQISANLSFSDRQLSEYSSSYTPSTLDLTQPQRNSNTGFQQHNDHPLSSMSSMPRLPQSSPANHNHEPLPSRKQQQEQEPLIPVLAEEETAQNPWSDVPHLETQQNASGNANYTSSSQVQDVYGGLADAFPPVKPQESSISIGQPMNLPIRPAKAEIPVDEKPVEQPIPPPITQRPTIQVPKVSPAELERLNKQRSETYQIKHFNWLDTQSRTLRRSSMLTQNKNGPCPLLALVNAIILSAPTDSQSALGKALASREQISLGLIIESLMDELTSDGRSDAVELPDVDELNRFLLTLHTGLNANPKFASPAPQVNLMDARNSMLNLSSSGFDNDSLGEFEATSDIRLYGAFEIPLLHGWLPPKSHPASIAFSRSAHTYEDAQTIQFGEEELESRLSTNGLSPAEQQLLQDIVTIKDFFKAYPTQLTPYGLQLIHDKLASGSFAILFRNDHFSTIFKHPDSGQIFTLVTDAGYSTHDEVIWESLVDVSGQGNDLYSGDFRPVGNSPQNAGSSSTNQRHSSSQQQQQSTEDLTAQKSPSLHQEQADADFALALQLQDEEEQRAETQRRNRSSSGVPSQNTSSTNLSNNRQGRNSSRPTQQQQQQQQQSQDVQSLIPPRTARRNPAPRVNRPAQDDDGEAPPPSYDEAAKGEPYIPPEGNPHFAGRPSLGAGTSSYAGSGGTPSSYSPSVSSTGRRRTTASGYQQDEHVARIQAQLGQPLQPGRPVQGMMNSNYTGSGTGRDRGDRDCIVM